MKILERREVGLLVKGGSLLVLGHADVCIHWIQEALDLLLVMVASGGGCSSSY
jgi:hypothetical protein